MTGSDSPMPLDAAVFDRIEAALSESARGRSFLDELGRRRRGAETERLLAAIARLENAVAPSAAAPPPAEADEAPHLRAALAEMAGTLAGSRAEIAGDRSANASGAGFEGVLRASERATSEILAAAEAVQEAAWSLRETGAEAALCDVLDRRAVAICAACADQDLTTQRLDRLVRTLDHLEERIAAALARGGRPVQAARRPAPLPDLADDLDFRPAANADLAPAASPMSTGEAVPESAEAKAPATDAAASEDVPATAVATPVASHAMDPVAEDLAAAFPDLDGLSIEEKIALFS